MDLENKQRLKIYIELEQHIAIISKNYYFLDDILLQLQNENLIFTIDLTNINSIPMLTIEYAKILGLCDVGKDDINEVLNAVEQLAVEKNKKAIVVFYNFDMIYKFGEDIIKKMRSIFQIHKNTVYIFAGSQASIMNTIFLDKDNAFFYFASVMNFSGPKIQ